jgi:hypothetical protein
MIRKTRWTALEIHPFSQKVMENSTNVYRRYRPTQEDLAYLRKHGKPKERRVPSNDFYFIQVENRLLNIFNALWRIEASMVFLGQYPYRQTLLKYGITRDQYLKYHLETYYVSVASCADRAALLVNDVFQLGLPGRLAKIYHVVQMDQLRDTKVCKVLTRLNDSLQSVIKVKNLITHEAEIEESELAGYYHYLLLSMHDVQLSDLQRVLLPTLTRVSLSRYLSKKRKELNGLNAKIQENLVAVFDQLLPVYDKMQVFYDQVRRVRTRNQPNLPSAL